RLAAGLGDDRGDEPPVHLSDGGVRDAGQAVETEFHGCGVYGRCTDPDGGGRAVDEGQIALRVDRSDVAGAEPSLVVGRRRAVPVPRADVRSPDQPLPELARIARGAVRTLRPDLADRE